MSVFSGKWADDQTRTFLGAVKDELGEGQAAVQMLEVNVEEDWMKAWIVRMSVHGLRRERRQEDWGRYFVVRRGMEVAVRQTLGMANGKVGYVYLVDEGCRIRWAGCGDATEDEREGLKKGVRKLIEAGKSRKAEEAEMRHQPRLKVNAVALRVDDVR